MDYRELLKKYMAHVVESEGVHFLHVGRPEVDMTAEEWEELRQISRELYDD